MVRCAVWQALRLCECICKHKEGVITISLACECERAGYVSTFGIEAYLKNHTTVSSAARQKKM